MLVEACTQSCLRTTQGFTIGEKEMVEKNLYLNPAPQIVQNHFLRLRQTGQQWLEFLQQSLAPG